MSDVGAMTKTAEERAREIVARAWLRRLFPSGYAASDEAKELRAMIAEGFRQTEREVWRAAAEVALKEADKWLYGDGHEHMACCELAGTFRLRAGDEV